MLGTRDVDTPSTEVDPGVDLLPSPSLMVWVTRAGVSVPRMDAPPELLYSDSRQGLDQGARHLRVDRAGLCLVQQMVRDAPASIDDAIDSVLRDLGTDMGARAELELLAEGLVTGGLLFPADSGAVGPVVASTWSTPPSAVVAPGSAPDPDLQWRCAVPVALPVVPDGFVHVDHEGSVLGLLDAAEVLVAAAYAIGRTVDEAHEAFVEVNGEWLGRDEFGTATDRLVELGLLAPFQAASTEQLRKALTRKFEAFAESDAAVLAVVDQEAERETRTGVRRPVVVPVDAYDIPMLSLGMVVAYARSYRAGALEDRFGFAPLWYTRADRFRGPIAKFVRQPAVFLFSHYTWTHDENLALSAATKELLPDAITVHGGPNVPKYEGDAQEWFTRHPHVDVAVHGEGEVTLAELLEALGTAWADRPDQRPDLSVLAEVPGLTYRTADGVHRTPDRERVEDLDTLPSPYLTGMFEHRKRWQWSAINLETNRGCPYGCTFCDWGSATLSRIRKFDLERVKAEMEWAAAHEFEVFSLTDANFGIFERDVEIAEWAVELHRRYGFPTAFQVNYAKNRVANLAQIVQILGDAGILTEGLVAVQTFDPQVLKTIRRSNIKQDRYDALTTEFRQVGLPLYTDVMVGLPGSTVRTVRTDFQSAIDRELHVKAHPTQLLVNSPMNEPSYRAEHGIVALPGDHLEEASTYTHEDWLEMMEMRRFFYFSERRGILRQVATYVRAETGMPETAFYDRVRQAGREPQHWPRLAYLTRVAPDEYVPPGSWRPTLDELGRFCVEELAVIDDSALETVLVVQHAVLPARGRRFPTSVELAHDYVRWHEAVIEAKRRHTDGTWPEQVGALRDFGPASFEVNDRDDCSNRVVGQTAQGALGEVIWELDSPITRPKQLT